jgi:hypothetical protein
MKYECHLHRPDSSRTCGHTDQMRGDQLNAVSSSTLFNFRDCSADLSQVEASGASLKYTNESNKSCFRCRGAFREKCEVKRVMVVASDCTALLQIRAMSKSTSKVPSSLTMNPHAQRQRTNQRMKASTLRTRTFDCQIILLWLAMLRSMYSLPCHLPVQLLTSFATDRRVSRQGSLLLSRTRLGPRRRPLEFPQF